MTTKGQKSNNIFIYMYRGLENLQQIIINTSKLNPWSYLISKGSYKANYDPDISVAKVKVWLPYPWQPMS